MIDINLKHPKISQKTNICHFELSGKLAIVRNRPLLLHNVYLENAMHPHLSIIFQITKKWTAIQPTTKSTSSSKHK